MNVDKNGYLMQIQLDGSLEGGDSACWSGHYIYFSKNTLNLNMRYFEIYPGAYVRHPNPDQTYNGFGAYYKNPWNGCISRDQLTGILLGLLKSGDKEAANRLVRHHLKSGMLFSYNTIDNGLSPEVAKWKMPDLTLFDIWALEIRATGKATWLLPLLDLHMLFNVLFDRIFSRNNDDVINLVGKLCASVEYYPTLISKFTAKLVDYSNVFNRIKNYWESWRAQPLMAYFMITGLKNIRK